MKLEPTQMSNSILSTQKFDFDLVRIFPFILLLLFISQLILWNFAVITDLNFWVTKRQQLISDIQNHNLDFSKNDRAIHPGTFPLIVSLPFSLAGFSPKYSIKTAAILLDTLISVGIIYAAYFAKKNNLWWLAITLFFIFNDYTLYTNPSDMITAKLITLSLILLLINFQSGKKTHWAITLLIGITLGLSASSRIHPTAALLPFVIIAFAYINPRRIPLLLFAFGISMFITNPYLWISPTHFLRASLLGSFGLVSENSGSVFPQNFFKEISLGKLIMEAPLSFLSYLLLFANLFVPKKRQILPRLYIFISILYFSLVTFLMLRSSLNTLRYFYPVLIPLQAMLPIFIFQLFDFSASLKVIRNTGITSKTFLYMELFLAILITAISVFSSNDTTRKVFLDISRIIITILFMHVLQILNKDYSSLRPKTKNATKLTGILPAEV